MPRSTKDWRKITRGFLEGILLLFLAYIIIKNLYVHRDYVPYQDFTNQSQTQSDIGFIALSYFGVAFSEDSAPSLISRNRLKEHLEALTQSGYVTITQQDIIDYYKKGKPIPEKSLFLMFADGRSDTAIFAGQILKRYNLKATILTYAQNIVGKDNKFLHKKDLNNLMKNGFWEFGSGGYRLTYINVFDHLGNFLNVLTSQEFNEYTEIIDGDYNHYLMDYIRDENRIPIEDFTGLTNRINYDYNEMVNIYEYSLNQVPFLYSLMHANTGKFGTNNKASLVNEENIKEIFRINFNRDGYSVNTGEADLYNLTRLSPKPDWYTNHLLMRIWQDTGERLAFQYGNKENLDYWEINAGQPEFLKDTIILTSPPEKEGILFLKNNEIKNQELSIELSGNRIGEQTVYLRAKKDLSNYIGISLKNNELLVAEIKSGVENVLYSKDLSEDNRILKISLLENELSLWLNGTLVVEHLNITYLDKGAIGLGAKASMEAFEVGLVEDSIYDGVFKNMVILSLDSDKKSIMIDMNLKGIDKFINNLKEVGTKILVTVQR